jgi:hypothetical protein
MLEANVMETQPVKKARRMSDKDRQFERLLRHAFRAIHSQQTRVRIAVPTGQRADQQSSKAQ